MSQPRVLYVSSASTLTAFSFIRLFFMMCFSHSHSSHILSRKSFLKENLLVLLKRDLQVCFCLNMSATIHKKCSQVSYATTEHLLFNLRNCMVSYKKNLVLSNCRMLFFNFGLFRTCDKCS